VEGPYLVGLGELDGGGGALAPLDPLTVTTGVTYSMLFEGPGGAGVEAVAPPGFGELEAPACIVSMVEGAGPVGGGLCDWLAGTDGLTDPLLWAGGGGEGGAEMVGCGPCDGLTVTVGRTVIVLCEGGGGGGGGGAGVPGWAGCDWLTVTVGRTKTVL